VIAGFFFRVGIAIPKIATAHPNWHPTRPNYPHPNAAPGHNCDNN
jgi:hypothetical protein